MHFRLTLYRMYSSICKISQQNEANIFSWLYSRLLLKIIQIGKGITRLPYNEYSDYRTSG